jgi:hypothetical protein
MKTLKHPGASGLRYKINNNHILRISPEEILKAIVKIVKESGGPTSLYSDINTYLVTLQLPSFWEAVGAFRDKHL